jgi:hypothetical protein
MQPLTNAIPSALRSILRDAPLSQGKAAFAWRAAVGPAVDRVTAVHLESPILYVDASGPQWSNEIRRSSTVILRRLEQLLGPGVVERLEVRTR